MKRRAIILGSPLYQTANPFSEGVRKDMIDYYNFFTSPTGGAYYDDEIIFIEDPTIDELKELKKKFTDFSVIAFSGHGAHNIFTNESIFTLNKKEKISISNLVKLVYSPRQLIIVDSCRNFVKVGGYQSFLGDVQTQLDFPSNLHFQTARRIYNNHLKKTSYGAQVIYSCSPGEYSRATYEGSYFSRSLLHSVRNWATRFEDKSVLTTLGAHKFAKDRLRTITQKQNPSFVATNKTSMNFPFAIRFGTELYSSLVS